MAAVDGWWPTDTSPGGLLRKWKWRKWNKLERKRWRVKSQSVVCREPHPLCGFGVDDSGDCDDEGVGGLSPI